MKLIKNKSRLWKYKQLIFVFLATSILFFPFYNTVKYFGNKEERYNEIIYFLNSGDFRSSTPNPYIAKKISYLNKGSYVKLKWIEEKRMLTLSTSSKDDISYFYLALIGGKNNDAFKSIKINGRTIDNKKIRESLDEYPAFFYSERASKAYDLLNENTSSFKNNIIEVSFNEYIPEKLVAINSKK